MKWARNLFGHQKKKDKNVKRNVHGPTDLFVF